MGLDRPPRHAGVRRATADDARPAADVWLAARHAAVPAIPPPVHDDDDVREWFAHVLLRRAEVWVAAPAGVGVIAVMALEDGWLDQLYVAPGWTGRGLGGQLVHVAKLRHPGGLDLWTFQSNRRARHFYESHGFAAVECTEGDNEEGAPDVRYHWGPAGPAGGQSSPASTVSMIRA